MSIFFRRRRLDLYL
ncbi:hypothetical protein BLA29_008510 [Euroglyphus maynei]|uniref:Uncharacterized protein n=1 Tax=Euroglyphus maynei TaxID=6958 RepID=A0A1Y3ASL5_EURMA|nr:hypothetical protein BLA29_008510 [Euroglyphus maynei]